MFNYGYFVLIQALHSLYGRPIKRTLERIHDRQSIFCGSIHTIDALPATFPSDDQSERSGAGSTYRQTLSKDSNSIAQRDGYVGDRRLCELFSSGPAAPAGLSSFSVRLMVCSSPHGSVSASIVVSNWMGLFCGTCNDNYRLYN